MKPSLVSKPLPTRRDFLRASAFAGIGVTTLGLKGLRAAPANSKLRVLSIGVIGTIGGTDRKAVASHPMAEITGLCDVDSNQLARSAKEHPNAFTCSDYRELLAPVKWRSWWNFGTNGLGDWGCHILDVLMFSYDELKDPISVKTDCPEPAGEHFHVNPCKSTIVYKVDSDKFTGETFPIHYWDSGQIPDPDQLRIPEPVKGGNKTAIICERGTLILEADGDLRIWRDGEMTYGLREPGLPTYSKLNHWHAWGDNCLGTKTELRTPFKDAVRITEPALLAVKATRFPGETLEWDKSTLSFTNNRKATETIVRREYREGFAPSAVG